jgi:PA14 domain
MMTRVRPVLMSQLGWTGGWLAPELNFIEDYYGNPAFQSAPHSASYFIYGAGGSAYENADLSTGANTTVDDVFNTMPVDFNQDLQSDMNWTAAFGLKRIAYEGGPSLDNLTANTNVPPSVLQAAWSDPRMQTELVNNQNTWSASGGDLFMYFASTGDYHWGLTNDPFNLNTQKLNAISVLNNQPAAPVTYGKAAPVALTSGDFNVPSTGTLSNMSATSLAQEWSGTHFRVDTSGNFDIQLTGTSSSGGQVEVFVDGKSYGIVNVPANGSTTPISLGTLAPGEHGILLRARAGTFGLGTVSILADNPPAVPPAPKNFNASAISPSSIQMSWNAGGTGQTGFLIERANDPSFSTNRVAFGTGPTATNYLDATASAGTTYYYRICALNGTVESPEAGPVSVTTPTSTGLAATYFDNMNLTGPTATRTDAAINFYWAPGAGPAPGIHGDTFSARWIGQIQAVAGGTYRFQTYSDDGVRLWVNDRLVINNWTDHAGTYNQSAAIVLKAGAKYDIRLEYYNDLGGGVMDLNWKPPTATGYVPIPTSQLTPASGGAALFEDGFDTGLANWTPTSGTWTAPTSVDGRGSAYVSKGTAPERQSFAGDPSWTDYSISAWVNLSNLGAVAILGRVTDATHYYDLTIQRNSNGVPAWVLMKRDGNVWTTLASGALTYTAGSWVRLRLTMSGSSLTAEFSRDGTTFSLLGAATDTEYAAGKIGLRSSGSTASFDEVMVQAV